MFKYFLYIILVLWVIKMYNLNKTKNILYASISIILGVFIINWLFPDKNTNIENFGRIIKQASTKTELEKRYCKNICKSPFSCNPNTVNPNTVDCNIYFESVSAVTDKQLAGLFIKNSLEPSEIREITPERIAIIIQMILPDEISQIKSEKITALTSQQLNAIISKLTQSQIAKLTTVQIGGITPQQIVDVPPTQLNAFKSRLTTFQKSALKF